MYNSLHVEERTVAVTALRVSAKIQKPKFLHGLTLRHSRGVTLLDTLVGTALMLVVFLGIAAAFQLSVNVVTNNKARAGAIALANERMEYLRSLSYTQIGVIGGIPAGNVPQEEEVFLNSISYTRRTIVLYSDDPNDGLGEDDENEITADYKTMRVEAEWMSRQGARSVALVGRVSPYGVETDVPGGTLVIGAVNEAAAPVSNAQVDIINTTTAPAISIRTFTNADGMVNFIGAPAASDYQITVLKPGYSSAQTYPVSVENPNPDPRHLTVADDQTTSAVFAIDYISTKTVEMFLYDVNGVWTDEFNNDEKLALMQDTEVSGGRIRVAGSAPYPPSASAQSIAITPQNLTGWKTLSWNDSEPGETEVFYHIYMGDGSAPVPESALPGNDVGFTNSPVDISSVSHTQYPSIRVHAVLMAEPPAGIPAVDEWTVNYTYRESAPNKTFTLRGNKAIGNNPSVYKYDEEHITGSDGRITLQNMEWDTYTIRVASTTGYSLYEACAPQPEVLSPGTTQATEVFIVSASAHSLLIDVRDNAGTLLTNASVRLTKSGYDETKNTSACGQSYFGGLTESTYGTTITKAGFQEHSTNIDVNDATRLSVVLNPL